MVSRASARELCADDICITRDQLAALLAATGQSPHSLEPTAHPSTPQAPVIELNGNASSTIEVGATYSDLGARIVAHESDLNLGIIIVLDGSTTTVVSLDTSTPGEHTLTGSAMRTVIIAPAEQSPAQPANDNPFNAPPANDNASATAVVDVAV